MWIHVDQYAMTSSSMCRSYVHFCACGKQLDKRFEALGARRFADRVDVHKEDLPAIDKWLAGLTATLPSMRLKTFQQLGGRVLLLVVATQT